MTEKMAGGAATPPEGKTVRAGCEASSNNFGLPKNKTSGRKKRPTFIDLPAKTQELMKNIIAVVAVISRRTGKSTSDTMVALAMFPAEYHGWEIDHRDTYAACYWLTEKGYLCGDFLGRRTTPAGMALLDHGAC